MKAEGKMKADSENIDLRTRTKDFALRVIKLYAALPKSTVAQVLGRQLLRSGTSVGAHYREASRARSDAEFLSRMQGGLAELDESAYWLELLAESEAVAPSRLTALRSEADELTAILVTCVKSAKRGRNPNP